MAAARKGSPPYLSYRTFRNFLDYLEKIGVPSRIDRSVMSSKSGTTQTLLLGAFRYLGLTSAKGVSTPELQRLVKAEGIERRDLWHKILAKAYPALFNAKMDLESATFEQFAEIFGQEVSSRNTLRKCVTFFSYSAKDAGINISPHLKPYAGTRSALGQARSRPAEVKARILGAKRASETQEGNDSSDLGLFLSKLPRFDPNWSDEQRKQWLLAMKGIKDIAGNGKVAGGFSAVEEDPDEDADDHRQMTFTW